MKKLNMKNFKWPKQYNANILFFVVVILAFAYIAIPRADGTLFGSYNMRMRPLSAPPLQAIPSNNHSNAPVTE